MRAATHKNGPKGIICVFFLNIIIKEIGKPISDPKKIANNATGKSNTKPKINISLISPPPIDSFLNIKSPSFLIENITRKAIKPLITAVKASSGPFKKKTSNNNNIPTTAKTPSEIIK